MKAKIEILEKRGNRLSILLNNVSILTANSIRRAIMTEVPTMAVEHVFIYKNTSVMDDEILAHRLGLIPLRTNLEKYVPNDECECKSELGCQKCSVTLYLEAKAEDEVKLVYSKDIRAEDEETSPVDPDIPIVKLAPGQEISIEMRAIMGRGKDHAKWQPVSVAVVRGVPIFSVDSGKCDTCHICVDSCPKKLIEFENGVPKLSNRFLCTTCKMCENECPRGAISISIDESSSILTIESNGQLSPEEIVLRAMDILIQKVENFKKELSGVKIE